MKMKLNSLIIYTIYFLIISLLINNCSNSLVRNLLRSKGCNQDSGIMSLDERKIILETHNALRNQIALGTNSVGPKLPYAQNMIQMYYNDAIGYKAQKHANKCTLIHSNKEERRQPQFKTGENIYTTTFYNGKPEKNWQKAIEMWFAEIKDFAGKSVVAYAQGGPTTGHFTQVIWANSYFVGCGFSTFSPMKNVQHNLYVCQYGPVGNIIGYPIYKASADEKTCNCPAELACNNVTFAGLCCPPGHCNSASVEFNGEPFRGTLPKV